MDTDFSTSLPPPHPALSLGYKPSRQSEDLEERIQNALKIVAQIISTEGEDYLPIFQRLEKELIAHQANKKSLQRALFLCETSGDMINEKDNLGL